MRHSIWYSQCQHVLDKNLLYILSIQHQLDLISFEANAEIRQGRQEISLYSTVKRGCHLFTVVCNTAIWMATPTTIKSGSSTIMNLIGSYADTELRLFLRLVNFKLVEESTLRLSIISSRVRRDMLWNRFATNMEGIPALEMFLLAVYCYVTHQCRDVSNLRAATQLTHTDV